MIYLLDKNIVEDIKKSLNNTASTGAALARSIDRKGAIVSPMLSIAEGSFRKPQTQDEMLNSLIVETRAIGMFYKHARTDANFLREVAVKMVMAFEPHWRGKFNELMPLAIELKKLLYRTYSVRDAKDIFRKIDSLCSKHSIPRVHPLVVCAIACLYGHSGARRVLKPSMNPSEGDAYNAISDIRMLMDTAYISQMFRQRASNKLVKLLSNDIKLNEFSQEIQIFSDGDIFATNSNEKLINHRVIISKNLFPMLMNNEKEINFIYSYFDGNEKLFNII